MEVFVIMEVVAVMEVVVVMESFSIAFVGKTTVDVVVYVDGVVVGCRLQSVVVDVGVVVAVVRVVFVGVYFVVVIIFFIENSLVNSIICKSNIHIQIRN